MRLASGFAIALALTLPALGQTASAPVPAETAPPPAAKKSPKSAAKAQPETALPRAGATGVDSKRAASNTIISATSAANTSSARASAKLRKQPAPVPTPADAPRKIVVRQGGAKEPSAQIVPGMTPAEAGRERQNAEQWLSSAGGQLEQLSARTLRPQQQETVGQIRNYMEGARSALQDGDVRRASTLAEKAHLLADDLAKH